jgi:AraC family transcriptional regulator
MTCLDLLSLSPDCGMTAKLQRGHYFGAVTQCLEVGGLLLNETWHMPHARIPPHSHQHAYFCLVRQGNYTETYGDRTRSCRPLTLAYHPAEEIHSEQVRDMGVRSFNVELSAAWAQRLHECAPLLRNPAEARGGPPAILALRLYREFRLIDVVSPLAIEGLVLEILAELVRLAVPPRLPPWLARARDLVHDRFQENLGLAQIAAAVGVHPVYLASTFRRHFRQTIGDYHRQLRVEFSCSQLAAGRAPLAEIALAAGFADQSHFARVFKRYLGITPGSYRKQFCDR